MLIYTRLFCSFAVIMYRKINTCNDSSKYPFWSLFKLFDEFLKYCSWQHFCIYLPFILFWSDATIYCPQRYTAMSHWMETVRSTMTFLRGKLLKLFYFNGDRRTIPTCPDEPVISFSPYVGVATHTPSVGDCRRTARYNLPFFVDRMGCKYMEWTTAVHEAVPGPSSSIRGLQGNIPAPVSAQ